MQRITLKREPRLVPRHTAFPYQLEAVDALKNRDYGAVFHEQGLGKTKIAIDILLCWLEEKTVDSVIVVTKKSLVQNWLEELRQHTYIVPRLLTQDKQANFYSFNSPARVYLAHYEVLLSEEERIKLFQRTRVIAAILDEAQKIKNPDAKLTQAALRLAPGFRKRLILTGTPIANRPYDIWSQIYFLDRGESLGKDFSQFKSNLDLTAELGDDPEKRKKFEDSLAPLFARISDFSVRETKAGGRISLPRKEIQTVLTDWETYQEEQYRTVRDEMRAVIVTDGIPKEDQADVVLKRILRLVQIAANPAIVDESYNAIPGKFPYLIDLVESILSRGEKAIIWSCFTKNVDWLASQLLEHNPVRVHGKLPIAARNRAISKFKTDNSAKILLATPAAAKEGLTLTVANHVIFYDRSFSLDDYLQAQDRIHRISQEKTCYVYNLIMKDSVDEWVDVLLKSKELAAKLGQGDISKEQYDREMTYDFSHVLRQILNIGDKH